VVFRADQEIGRDLAAVDWASTQLGPTDGRPQSINILTDNGTWKTPRKEVAGAGPGRGIVFTRGLMEDFTIDSGDAGTTVHLYARMN
jgi:hypothetical protein